ncbi:alpha/beta hydrolase [Nocardia sp. NPDC051463]|uniref:alpha/beta fold hydrolase n=1 Tax=Nocardia sp. NPDC051463 TaxID=3154845 RepID=UPI00343DC56B
MRSEILKVPGATLFYEIRGSGPVLLMLPGSGGDAAIFDQLAEPLAEHFTVVAIDPRGYSHSTLDDPERGDLTAEVMSDDAHRLLEHLTPAGEDVYVFGGSGGAVVALDLLTKHPERLRLVIAHEPPIFAILPDAAAHRVFIDEVCLLLRTEGAAAAAARFAAGVGVTMKGLPDPDDLPPRAAGLIRRLMANGPVMIEHELRPITSYLPDESALTSVSNRLVLGAGELTRGKLPHRPAAALAERLGLPLTIFPGGHSGFTDEPAAFTQLVLDLLLGARGATS